MLISFLWVLDAKEKESEQRRKLRRLHFNWELRIFHQSSQKWNKREMVIGARQEMCVSGLKLSRRLSICVQHFWCGWYKRKWRKFNFLEEGRNELTSNLGSSGVHKWTGYVPSSFASRVRDPNLTLHRWGRNIEGCLKPEKPLKAVPLRIKFLIYYNSHPSNQATRMKS